MLNSQGYRSSSRGLSLACCHERRGVPPLAVTLGRGWGLYGSADSSWGPLASCVRPRDPPVVLNSIMVPQLLSGRGLNAMLLTARFPEGIAPACPIHTKPVIPFDARLSFELYFP